MKELENYLTLVERVEALCSRTVHEFAAHISCRAGCDACCRHLSIFSVEAAALRQAASRLPAEVAWLIREKTAGSSPDGPCPVLHDGLCLLYEARPIICRTHGLPLLLERDGARCVDYCPENFHELETIPGSAVIDLERLNTMLTAINSLYLQSFPGPERVTIAEVIALAD